MRKNQTVENDKAPTVGEEFYTPETVPLPINRNLRYSMARNGELPVIRCGRRLLIPKIAFEEWLRTCGGTFVPSGGAK
jgi:excisionase family DNA binding protein